MYVCVCVCVCCTRRCEDVLLNTICLGECGGFFCSGVC